ncbi:MAG: glycosyltransferase family 8 protein [Bacteroidales bacterium]|nr:glycosyltransferase family 8 protein [Bacteroidales bacterium]MEE1302114.1 glycosyltransferase family 8 protein [Bacteroidales bacterium]MEE1323255.1 glycosyltransferase family 8 protein [Bacteroidales bacterium]
MNIAYSCDNAYIEQTGISLISVFENNKDEKEIVVYLISKGITKENIEILDSICKSYNRSLIVVKFEDICFDLPPCSVGRHLETIYAKVFFSRIEGLDKVLYLDSDVVVVGKLKPLWENDLSEKYMGVVETTYTKGKKALGIPRSTPFFNDGVVLVNVDYCRENNLISKVIEQVNAFGGNPPVLSEGVLNKICGQNVKYISLRYNLISGNLYFGLYDYDYLFEQLHYEKEDLIDSCENPVIVHYIAGFYNRPWCKKCTHPFKEFYLYYKSISPWKDSPLQDKDLSFKIKVAGLAYKVFGCRFIDKIRDILGLLD